MLGQHTRTYTIHIFGALKNTIVDGNFFGSFHYWLCSTTWKDKACWCLYIHKKSKFWLRGYWSFFCRWVFMCLHIWFGKDTRVLTRYLLKPYFSDIRQIRPQTGQLNVPPTGEKRKSCAWCGSKFWWIRAKLQLSQNTSIFILWCYNARLLYCVYYMYCQWVTHNFTGYVLGQTL